ncbi:energy transducer TonB [Undibacterium terreum]|uniref:TonB C-terminal domain-containing protein n=1 Tax=Undibacterium terreum TaxID=1224302 RepID=A0A916ULJ3_9BURK|nr:energy transducer TonB [Undibacterium terreum]GGC77629.1 hypothetical protein GCM10011396_25990 [Undibacterium terreum]
MSESIITTSNPYRPDRVRARLAAGIGLSILLHAFILSLQFGIPGLALPGLELPWNKRRAQAPELTVQLADAAPPALPPPLQQPVPELSAPLPPLPPLFPIPKPISEGFTLVAPVKPPEPLPVTKAPAKPKALVVKKTSKVKPPPPLPVAEEASTSPPQLITRLDNSDDKFVVPVPSPEEPLKPASTVTDKVASVAQVAEPQVADVAASQPAEDTNLQKQLAEAEARHLREVEREVEERKLADEAKQQAALLAQKQEERRQEERKQEERMQAQRAQEMIATAARQQEADARKLAEANAALAMRRQQEALQLQAKQQAELEKQREQLKLQQAREELARAQQLETQRQEEQKRQEQARQQAVQLAQQEEQKERERERILKEQQAQERKLKEQAEETARQQALAQTVAQAQARQKQLDEFAAKQRADELARQQAEAASLAKAAANVANAAAAGSGNADGKPAQGFVLPKSLLGSDLASRALDQAKKLDLLRGNPPVRRVDEEVKGRRRSLLGTIKEDVPLRMYVESWRQKIERNGNLNYSRIAKDKARGDPVVTVAIRSDGSVEEIIINRSSGRADIDEAVRRIVTVNARYSAFPPNIAEKYDVIEIRRIWNFDETLKILEEMQ